MKYRSTTIRNQSIYNFAIRYILFFFAVGVLSGCASTTDQSIKENALADESGDKGNKIFLFHEENEGKDILWKAVFKNGEIQSLYRNGKKIPSGDIGKYKNIVYENLDNINENVDNGQMDFHINFDGKKFGQKMKRIEKMNEKFNFDSTFTGFDEEKFLANMENLRDKLSHLRIDLKFDSNKFSCDMQGLMKHSQFFNFQNFKRQMEKFSEKMKEHEFAMKDFHIDMSELDEKMGELKENMKDLNVKMKSLSGKLKNLDNFMKHIRHELKNDGYIKNENDDFDMELTASEMTVNGKKLPENLYEKYKDIYKKDFGKEISKNNSFRINK